MAIVEWREATYQEMVKWPTLAMLQQHFRNARLVPDATRVNFRYEVLEKKRRKNR